MPDVPIGAILPFYGNQQQLPVRFLFCSGDPVSRTQFPDLYNHLVLANAALRIDAERAYLPDLRGQFIRAWDNGKGVDEGRALGSYQEDMVEAHSHTVPGRVQFHVGPGGGFSSVDNPKVDTNRDNPPTSSFGGHETRPKNIAVNFIIRALP